ncbi:MAG: hypothetical protein ACKN81_12665, partial [Pirellulaceae bacterium]
WWAFCRMLFAIHIVADSLGSWAESCPCHEFNAEVGQAVIRFCSKARLPTGSDGAGVQCRMRGRRAPEMATGRLANFFQQLWDSHFEQLLLECSCELVPSDRDELLQDLRNAKTYISQILTQKCAFWEQLPWKLCGLASADARLARTVASSALATFDRVSNVRGLHHPVTWKFLAKDEALRSDVEKMLRVLSWPPCLLYNLKWLRWHLFP